MPSPFESSLYKEENRFEELSKLMTEQAVHGAGLIAFGACDEEEIQSISSQFEPAWRKEKEGEPLERGDFQLATRLGSGSQGHVHEVGYKQDQESTMIVKAKYLKLDMDFDAVWREIFLHKLLTENANSSHETGIVELLGYKRDGHKISMFMPKCKLTLAKVIPMIREMLSIPEEKRTAQFLLFDLFASLVRALKTLAKQGVVHCDIKPENIMLSPDGVDNIVDWCLIDLGCASKPESEYDAGKTFRGTLPYVSPEAMIRHENFPPRDVWSVGYVLNEIIFPLHEPADLSRCSKARAKALEEADRREVEDPILSESDLHSEIYCNSEVERHELFRLICESLVGRKLEAEKKQKTDFNSHLYFLISAMLDQSARRRPTAMQLAKWLPELEKLLPFQRPMDYGKAAFLKYFEMWANNKEDEQRKGSLYSLDSGMFGSSGGKRYEKQRERDPSLSLSSTFGSTQRPGIFDGSSIRTPSESMIEEIARNPRVFLD